MAKDQIQILEITMQDTADGFKELLNQNNLYQYGVDGDRYYSIPKFFKELENGKLQIMTPEQVPDKVRQSVLFDFLSKEELIHMIRGVSHDLQEKREYYPWDISTLDSMDRFELEMLYQGAVKMSKRKLS